MRDRWPVESAEAPVDNCIIPDADESDLPEWIFTEPVVPTELRVDVVNDPEYVSPDPVVTVIRPPVELPPDPALILTFPPSAPAPAEI